MLPVPFTFQGRLERLPYFKGCLGLVGACFVPAFLAFRMAPKLRDHDTSAVVALAIMLALIGITLGWISLAMQVRRFRDMGWPALYVIPAWWALQAADPFVAMNFPAITVGRQHNHTAAGLLLNLFMMGALFFWPSREDDEHPSLTEHPSVRMRGISPPRLPSSAPAIPLASASPRTSVLQPRTSFGRR